MEREVQIAEVCVLAGKIMLVSGAETHRVEDTMLRIAKAYGIDSAQSYATPTGLNFSTGFTDGTRFMRISKRSTDLHKIAEVNRISRMIANNQLSIAQALDKFSQLETRRLTFSYWAQVISAALVSGCFTIMFGGSWHDFLPALLTGGFSFLMMLLIYHLVEIRFVADFFASFIIGLVAYLFIKTGYGHELDKIIIGAVMPLVPGLPITNAFRDLLAGHLVAGVSKGVEALLTAFAIGAGVAISFVFI